MSESDEVLGLAIDLARRAGSIQRDRYETEIQIEIKSSAIDLVTEVDRECEALMVAEIEARRPGDAILAEEGGGSDRAGAEWRWLIDPLDGTTNYAHGYPRFCVSIGIERNDRREVAVVYDPLLDELFRATRGGGDLAQLVALLEGHDARKRYAEAVVERTQGEVARARVAVEHTFEIALAFAPPDVEELVIGVRFVSAHVDRDRHIELASQSHLLRKDDPLRVAIGVHVVVVESAFAQRDDAIVSEPAAQRGASEVVEFAGLVRMHTGGREHAGVALGQRNRVRVARHAVARADRDQRVDARLSRASEDCGSVLREAVARQVAM